jgi:hypothetical protein
VGTWGLSDISIHLDVAVTGPGHRPKGSESSGCEFSAECDTSATEQVPQERPGGIARVKFIGKPEVGRTPRPIWPLMVERCLAAVVEVFEERRAVRRLGAAWQRTSRCRVPDAGTPGSPVRERMLSSIQANVGRSW